MNAEWVDEDYVDPEYEFTVRWQWRLKAWVLNDLSRLRFWR